MLAFMLLIIGIWSNIIVYASYDYLGGISQLAFAGEGEKTCVADGNCAAKFSSGFRGDICSYKEYNTDKACWGVSIYDAWLYVFTILAACA